MQEVNGPIHEVLDPQVARKKFEAEVAPLSTTGPVFKQRGIWIQQIQYPVVEVAFTATVGNLTIIPVTIRMDFTNYDLHPPSVVFIDPFTRDPAPPPVQAWLETETGTEKVLINQHPLTGLPFLCIPGIREYHTHPQHDGDPWLIHRTSGEGSLGTIIERIWQTMIKPINALSVQVLVLPAGLGEPVPVQVQVALQQGPTQSQTSP